MKSQETALLISDHWRLGAVWSERMLFTCRLLEQWRPDSPSLARRPFSLTQKAPPSTVRQNQFSERFRKERTKNCWQGFVGKLGRAKKMDVCPLSPIWTIFFSTNKPSTLRPFGINDRTSTIRQDAGTYCRIGFWKRKQ